MKATAASESVLRALLAQLARAHDTPLQFGLDGRPLIPATLPDAAEPDWPAVLAQFDEIIRTHLASDDIAEPGCVPQPARRPGPAGSHPLEAWLEQIRMQARAVHPQAAAILAARVDGFDDRDIARRLGLGHRMIRAIAAELRAQWPRARSCAEA